MTYDFRRRAIRAYMAENGVNYTTAMRAVDAESAARRAAKLSTETVPDPDSVESSTPTD